MEQRLFRRKEYDEAKWLNAKWEQKKRKYGDRRNSVG
jgi:hypothetical protein